MAVADPHAHAPLYERGAELATARAVAIVLHGRELGAANSFELADRLALPGVAFAIPEADQRSWYPVGFLSPLAANQPRLDYALARVDELVARALAAGVERSRIAVVGFSQGACLALEWLARTRTTIGGVIAFTGGLIGPPGTRWPGPVIETPVLITTSDIDEWVPIARVRESVVALTERGADVTLEVLAGRPHLVDDREISLARTRLAAL